MPQVNIHHAKTHLSRLVERAAAGEEVIIAKSGRPVAKLVALTTPTLPRRSGSLKGQIRIGKDFDAPLTAEFAEVFGIDLE